MSLSEVAGLQENTSDSADIFMAIEASIAALYVLATPGLPKQAYPEDTIERTVEVVKFHLMSNVMAFHDPRLCQIHRPQLLAGSGGAVHSSVLKIKGHNPSHLLLHAQEKDRGIEWCRLTVSLLFTGLMVSCVKVKQHKLLMRCVKPACPGSADAAESGEEENTPKKARSAGKSARKPAKQATLRCDTLHQHSTQYWSHLAGDLVQAIALPCTAIICNF